MVSDTDTSTPTKVKGNRKGKGKAKAPYTPEPAPEINTQTAASDGDANSDTTVNDEMLRALSLPFRSSPKTTPAKSLDDGVDTSNVEIFSSGEEVEITSTPDDRKKKENARKAAQKKRKQQAKKDAAAATSSDEVVASASNNVSTPSIAMTIETTATAGSSGASSTVEDGKGKAKADNAVAAATGGQAPAPGSDYEENPSEEELAERTRKVLRSVKLLEEFVDKRPDVSHMAPDQKKATDAAFRGLQAVVLKLHVMVVSPGRDINIEAVRGTINLYAEHANILVNNDPIKIMPHTFTTLKPSSVEEHLNLFAQICKWMNETIVLNLPTYKSGKFLGMIDPEDYIGDTLQLFLRSRLLQHNEKTTVTSLYVNISARAKEALKISDYLPKDTFSTFTAFDYAQMSNHWGGMMAMLLDSIPAPKRNAVSYYGPRNREPIPLPQYGFPHIDQGVADYTIIDTAKAAQMEKEAKELIETVGPDATMKLVQMFAKEDAEKRGAGEEGAGEGAA